jgi:hypothetical protein
MKTTKERPLKVSLVASMSAEDEIRTHRINRTAAAWQLSLHFHSLADLPAYPPKRDTHLKQTQLTRKRKKHLKMNNYNIISHLTSS